MKKICNLTITHTRHDQRVFLKECLTEKQNYEVHLVVCDGEPDELNEGIYIHGTPKHKTRLGRVIFSTFEAYLKAKALKADVYVFHDPDFLWLAFLLKRRGSTVIWDCHETYFDRKRPIQKTLWFLHHILFWLFKGLALLVVRHLDGAIAPANTVKDWLAALGCKKCYLLHNYALRTEFQCVKSPNYNEAIQRILYIGAFSTSRNIHILIEAIALCKHKNVRLTLCGSNARKPYETYCRQLSGWSRVEFYRDANRKVIRDLQGECFASVVSYAFFEKSDSSPVKFFEYMALSLPIILGGNSVTEFYKTLILNDGHPLGLIIDSDPQAIADAIDYLYENKEVARTMGMNGRKAFETKYNFESEADGFLKFLEEVSQSKNQNK